MTSPPPITALFLYPHPCLGPAMSPTAPWTTPPTCGFVQTLRPSHVLLPSQHDKTWFILSHLVAPCLLQPLSIPLTCLFSSHHCHYLTLHDVPSTSLLVVCLPPSKTSSIRSRTLLALITALSPVPKKSTQCLYTAENEGIATHLHWEASHHTVKKLTTFPFAIPQPTGLLHLSIPSKISYWVPTTCKELSTFT